MRYIDLLKKLNAAGSAPAHETSTTGTDESFPKSSNGGTPDRPLETYIAGDTVIGTGGKESELERLYLKMEKYMSFGHGLLTLDEEIEHNKRSSLPVESKFGGRGVKEDCIAPSNGKVKCWDLNIQLGTRTFEECFECPVYSGNSGDPDDEGKESSDSREVQTDERRRARRLYDQFVDSIMEVYHAAKTDGKIDLDAARGIASRLIDVVSEDNKLLWQAINIRRGSQIASHVLNVAVFSIRIGSGLKYTKDELLLLATAAVLHDLGMTAIPGNIIDKKDKLTRKEYDLIKRHPVYSMEIIRNSVGKSNGACLDTERLIRIVGEEHERENGSGYPEGKKSGEIDELAKVIGVLDVFEALSHDRGHRSEYSSFQAIQVIIQMRNEFFSNRVVKAVITEMSIFPLESYVRLNNGETGKVVKTNYAHPMRPVIRIVRDSRGKKLKKTREVDLSNSPLIFITRPVEEEES